ncbi:sensor histidine kinase [Phreatobacter cathodiphilus]
MPDPALSLALAVVASSTSPLVLLETDMTVIGASPSFCRAFQIDPASVDGRSVFALGQGEWGVANLRSLLRETAMGTADVEAYEFDLDSPALGKRRLVLHAHRLVHAAGPEVRVLLEIFDATDERSSESFKQSLIRDKAALLQEVHHRVANSLQIIASVLMQSARRVQSEEARGHLTDARNRVMSIASVERQLADSQAGDVHLRDYFTALCRSLAASMIRDPEALTLTVEADDTTVSGEFSISLGLTITELVINSLKHAFADERRGAIVVAYSSGPTGWTLSVTDNGVGMPTAGAGGAKSGLGTSIVEALANRMQATIYVNDMAPGTQTKIVHEESTQADTGLAAIAAGRTA